MRLPRFFAKKRGHRRTGAEVWGSVGEALFHGVLVVAGLAFGGLLVTGVAVPEWRINHDFVATRGLVEGVGLARRTTGVGAEAEVTWQAGRRLRYVTPAGEIAAWAFHGPREADRRRALDRLDRDDLGRELTCWYDPDATGKVVLERGYNWWMWALTLLLPGALLAFGGAGLMRSYLRWGKSEERRAATRGGPGALATTPAGASDHPSVPGCDDLVNSPGTILRFRLPLESPDNWTLLGFGLFAVLWNVVLTLLAVNAGLDLMGGHIDWLLLSILVPFAAVGITGLVVFIRRLFLTTAVGPTQLEISDHPLRPDGTYDLLLAQGGSGAFDRIELFLEIEEQATFRQGTDTRTERVIVWRQELGCWRELQLTPGTRFEARSSLHVPAKAMHSFVSEHNAVNWRIVVRGSPDRWPAFTRSFPIVVFPAAVTEAAG